MILDYMRIIKVGFNPVVSFGKLLVLCPLCTIHYCGVSKSNAHAYKYNHHAYELCIALSSLIRGVSIKLSLVLYLVYYVSDVSCYIVDNLELCPYK